MKKKLLVGAAVAGGAALALRRLAPALRDMHESCRELMHDHCRTSSAAVDCKSARG
jgi:hypothetical protein